MDRSISGLKFRWTDLEARGPLRDFVAMSLQVSDGQFSLISVMLLRSVLSIALCYCSENKVSP